MSARTEIKTDFHSVIVEAEGDRVVIAITWPSGAASAELTADQADELLRAVGKARVEISKDPPR